MPTIQNKIDKWFIDPSSSEHLPDQSRYEWSRPDQEGREESNVRHHARASVSRCVEGGKYQNEWKKGMEKIKNHPESEKCSVYHAAWAIENVNTLGKGGDQEARVGQLLTSVDNLYENENTDAGVFMLISNHYYNVTDWQFINQLDIDTIAEDTRQSTNRGSTHQKFTVFDIPENKHFLVGSADINKGRWGQRDDRENKRDHHRANDPERPRGPTHEVGVKVEGNAFSDIAWTFVERWNDQSRDNLHGHIADLNEEITSPYDYEVNTKYRYPGVIPRNAEPTHLGGGEGEQRVQVLRTYGRYNNYSWGERNQGEWTIWAAYLNAIKEAEEYIYIEDQYCAPLGHSVDNLMMDDEDLQEFSIFHQLRKNIINNDANVIIVTKQRTNSKKLDRRCFYGILRLRQAANQSESGDFAAAILHNDQKQINTHSKILLGDDVFSLIGSACINSRSMTNDGELTLGILDENENPSFTTRLRWDLWEEYTGYFNPEATLSKQVSDFIEEIKESKGLLRKFAEIHGVPEPYDSGVRTWAADVYGGPPKTKLRGLGE